MERPRSWPLALALLCVSGLAAAMPLSAQAASPCETEDSYRALDFLLGEWRLVSGGETVGRSRVEKLEDGCLVAETWSFVDGESGRTYSSFDAGHGEWRRFTVSNRGAIVSSDGAVERDELVIDGLYFSGDGEMSYWHERFTRMADGRIARLAGTSRRVGRGESPTTVLFEGHYVPAGSPEPRPASAVETTGRASTPAELSAETPAEMEPQASEASHVETLAEAEPLEPAGPLAETAAESARSAPAAPAAGEVTAVSARADDAASIERIAMASPMVLRLSLGAVESLPDGYAWTTRDTAPYLCEGVTIERLEVSRRARRGQVELLVELALHAVQVNRRVDVEIDLVEAGPRDESAAVASGSASGRAGRSIPEQIEHGSVGLQVVLPMTRQAFDAAVAAAERPELVITLAAHR